MRYNEETIKSIIKYNKGATEKIKEQQEEIERLHSIIKEVREYIPNCGCDDEAIFYIENILDKVGDSNG